MIFFSKTKTFLFSGALLLLILFTCLTFIYRDNRSKGDEITALNAKLEDLKNEVQKVEAENSDLEEKLSQVNHFDDDAEIGHGFSPSAVNYTGPALATQIDGDFNGWDGNTIFKMTNGSIWEQAVYAYTYDYSFMPSVVIYKKGGIYYMKVDGVDDVIQVRQIK